MRAKLPDIEIKDELGIFSFRSEVLVVNSRGHCWIQNAIK